jgi:hypothetical protein
MVSRRPSHEPPASASANQSRAREPEGTDPASRPGRRWSLPAGPVLLVAWVAWVALGLLVPLGAAGFLVLGAALVVLFQLVRRTSVRRLLARDSTGLTRSRTGKASLAVALLLIPAFLMVRYVPTWVDDSWIAVLTVAVLAVAYVALRRIVVALTLTAVVIAAVSWSHAPQLATSRSGDPQLLAQLSGLKRMGRLQGFQDVAVAKIDMDAPQPVSLASLGAATATTPMEIGSITKALTGLVAQIGEFWRVSHWQTGQNITWHNGGSAGYTSYFGLDRPHRSAVIVLSDVAVDPDTTDLGVELLAQRQ